MDNSKGNFDQPNEENKAFLPPPYEEQKGFVEPPGYVDSQGHYEAELRFKSARKWQDVWALVLFLVDFVILMGLCAYGAKVLFENTDNLKPWHTQNNRTNHTNFTTDDVVELVVKTLPTSLAISYVLTGVYFSLLYFCTYFVMVFSIFALVILFVGCGVCLIAFGVNLGSGISLLIVGVLMFLFFTCCFSKMRFAAILLKSVLSVMAKYPSTIFVSYLSLGIGCCLATVWGMGFIGFKVFMQFEGVQQYGLLVFFLFSVFWGAEVLKNTLHTSVAGVVAMYYFLGETVQMVRSPMLKSAKIAFGPSAGSICLGSLLLALIETLRSLTRTRNGRSLLDCCFGIIQNLAEYANKYAFVHCAVYGKSYVNAAKDTWRMFKAKGLEAIINDSITDNCLLVGQVMIGAIVGAISWVIATNCGKDFVPQNLQMLAVIISGVIGMLMFAVISGTIKSGVATIFVCLAEDPAALARTKPELYESILKTYPELSINVPIREEPV